MTIIAWDGKTLAADKRLTNCGMASPVTKIFRCEESLIGISGEFSLAQELINWYKNGCEIDKFPAFQRDEDDYVGMLVINKKGVFKYGRTPFPMILESQFFAIGSGRDYAMAAMHLGKTAVEAVEIASIFDCGCGNGVDSLTL